MVFSFNPIHHGLFLACVAMGVAQSALLKISKTKNDLSINFPHRSMYPLSPFFACFPAWFVSRDVTMASFL